MLDYNEKLWNYANKTLNDLANTEERCDRLLQGLKKFSEEEKLTLKIYWRIIKGFDTTQDEPVEELDETQEQDIIYFVEQFKPKYSKSKKNTI